MKKTNKNIKKDNNWHTIVILSFGVIALAISFALTLQRNNELENQNTELQQQVDYLK